MQVCKTARLILYIVTVDIYGSLYIYIISVHTAAEVRMTLDLCSDHMRSKASQQSFSSLPGTDDGDDNGEGLRQASTLLRIFITCTFCAEDMNDASKV